MKSTRSLLVALIILGCLAKFFGLNAPWARKDHYNYGGVHTSQMVECHLKVPWNISKGVVMTSCPEGGEPTFYANHPPTIIYEISALTQIFGSTGEWVYRLFGIFFSLLNIALVFLIARQWRPESQDFPLWAAAFQSLSLFSLYYGSHVDFISEFALTPILMSVWFALRGRAVFAGFAAIAGGLSSWPGFLHFGALFGERLLRRRSVVSTILLGAVGVLVGLAAMMWLRQTFDITEFLRGKLTKPGYVAAADADLFYPLRWLHKMSQQLSWLLSPAFLFLVLMELATRTRLREWTREELGRLWLLMGAGVLYLLLGRDFFYIHAFLHMYLLPGFSLLAASWAVRWLERPASTTLWSNARVLPVALAFVPFVFYPYGMLKTNAAHDAVNSLALVTALVLAVLTLIRRRDWTPEARHRRLLVIVAISGLANISQMISYRREPTRDFEFCERARVEHERTGQPVSVPDGLDAFFTRDYYCAGIPLREEGP